MNTSALPILLGESTDFHKDPSTKIKKIIAEKIGKEEHELKNDSSFSDDLNVDSLDVSEIIVEIEKEFKITIPDEEMEKLNTVGKVVNYVIKLKD